MTTTNLYDRRFSIRVISCIAASQGGTVASIQRGRAATVDVAPLPPDAVGSAGQG